MNSALEALSTIGSGAVTVSLSAGVYIITFGGGSLDNTNVNPLQGDVSTATYGTVDRAISTTYDFASRITGVNSFQDGQTYYTHDATDQLTDADHTGQAARVIVMIHRSKFGGICLLSSII